jgi:hypothetical protein
MKIRPFSWSSVVEALTPSVPRRAACFAAIAASVALAATTHAQSSAAVEVLGGGSSGSTGKPSVVIGGSPIVGNPFVLGVRNALPNGTAIVGVSLATAPVPLPTLAATIHLAEPFFLLTALPVDADGASPDYLSAPVVPAFVAGLTLYTQAVVVDPAALGGLAFTSGLAITLGERSSPLEYVTPAITGFEIVASADLDGDGNQDLVGTIPSNVGFSNPGAAICLGMGGGSYSAPSMLAGPATVAKALFVDLDGDSHLDMVVEFKDLSSLGIYYGAGAGAFEAVVVVPFSAPISDFEIADFEGDGEFDLAVVMSFFQGIGVRSGLGSRQYGAEAVYGAQGNTGDIAVGDFTADGIDDLVLPQTGGQTGQLAVFVGDPSGVFTSFLFLPTVTLASAVDVGDFNGDGVDDLLVLSNPGVKVSLQLGAPTGGLEPPTTVDLGSANPRAKVVDLDLDGQDEGLVAWQISSGNDPKWTLVRVRHSTTGLIVDTLQHTRPTTSFQAVDFDGDGIVDVACTRSESVSASSELLRTTSTVLHRATAPAQFDLDPVVGGRIAFDIAIDDFDQDGALDAAGLDANFSLTVLLGSGDGTFQSVPSPTTMDQAPTVEVSSGRIDSDALPDVVLANHNFGVARIVVLLNQGAGRFAESAVLVLPQFAYSRRVSIADIDGDTINDLVASDSKGGFTVFPGIGNGQFGAPVTHAAPPGATSPGPVVVADFDGGGVLDVLVLRSSHAHLHLGLGGGAFAAPLLVSGLSKALSAVAADFNGDGQLDIAGANLPTDYVSIVLGQGGGTFSAVESYSLGGDGRQVFASDMDGDSRLDVVARTGGGLFTILFGRGDGTFEGQRSYASTARLGRLGFGDFDGDSAVDVLATDGLVEPTRFLSSQLFR